MKRIGIIAEYNPFHLGHAYQLAQVKAQYPDHLIGILMSGNVVQRGEFAWLDKWTRGEAALKAGADLVLELPTLVSLQGADYFADYGMHFLSQLACHGFVFGTESASGDQLLDFSAWLSQHQEALDGKVQEALSQGYSYAKSLAEAYETLYPGPLPFDPSQGNHTLALAYIRANQQLASRMAFQALPRISVHGGQEIQSGSEIRQAWLNQQDLGSLAVPDSLKAKIRPQQTVYWPDYYPLLRYRLTLHSPGTLRRIFGVREGLEHRILKENLRQTSWEDLIRSLTSRRWTRSSIQRILMAVVLDLHRSEAQTYQGYLEAGGSLRVLACSQLGQAWIRQVQQQRPGFLWSKLRRGQQADYQLNIRADQVYQQIPGKDIPDQIRGRYPIRKVP